MNEPNAARRQALLRACALLGAPLLAGPAHAAETAARLYVGFPAGGTADTLARALAPVLSSADVRYLVENKPGAASQIAADAVRSAVPDGASLLVAPSSVLSLVPHLYRKPMYDGVADFAPVGCVCDHSFALAVPGTSPLKTVAEFINWARANSSLATYATPGAGSGPHFLGVQFTRETGVPLIHVPYRGTAPGIQDLIGGQVGATFNPLPTLIEFHKSGRIRILAVTNPARVASLPDVPTFTELKLPGMEMLEWYGVFAGAKVPPATVEVLQQRLLRALAQPAMAEAARRMEVTLRPLGGADTRKLLEADSRRWRGVVQATGIQLEG